MSPGNAKYPLCSARACVMCVCVCQREGERGRERERKREVLFRSIAWYLADLEACQHPPCEISIAVRGVDKCASPSERRLTYPSL